MRTYASVSANEAIRSGEADEELQALQDINFHLNQVVAFVRVVADVDEVADGRRNAFLETTRDY